jgi:hypothetical protein
MLLPLLLSVFGGLSGVTPEPEPVVLYNRRFRMRHYGLVAKERRNTEVIDGLDGN